MLLWVNLSEESLVNYSECGALYITVHGCEMAKRPTPASCERLLNILKHEEVGVENVLRRTFLAIRESQVLTEECIYDVLVAANALLGLRDDELYLSWWKQPVLRSAISALDREALRPPDDDGNSGYSDYYQLANWAQCLLLLEYVLDYLINCPIIFMTCVS